MFIQNIQSLIFGILLILVGACMASLGYALNE